MRAGESKTTQKRKQFWEQLYETIENVERTLISEGDLNEIMREKGKKKREKQYGSNKNKKQKRRQIK